LKEIKEGRRGEDKGMKGIKGIKILSNHSLLNFNNPFSLLK
jgi:hypothetical protein